MGIPMIGNESSKYRGKEGESRWIQSGLGCIFVKNIEWLILPVRKIYLMQLVSPFNILQFAYA